MNVKKEVYERVAKLLNDRVQEVKAKIWHNRNQFFKLEKEQTILKRELAELDKLCREYAGKKETEA